MAPLDASSLRTEVEHAALGVKAKVDGRQLAYKYGGTLSPITKAGKSNLRT